MSGDAMTPQLAMAQSFLDQSDLPPAQPAMALSFLDQSDLPTAELPSDGGTPAAPEETALAAAGRIASDVGTGIKEAPAQAYKGVVKGVNELSSTAFSAAAWLNEHIIDLGQVTADTHGSANPMNWELGYSRGMPSTNDARIPDAAIPGNAESVTGGLIEGATQFATGMALAGKFLRPFGIGAAATNTLASGASMATAFAPHEQRLSDLVQSYPDLANPVTEFLATHPDDSEAMARFRAGLEGLGIGAATEGVMAGVKALRSHYAGGCRGGRRAC